jgi:hypothetical protein
MTVETATYINQLDSSKPASGDARSEGDDHMRLLKSTLQATFPNISGAVTATQGQLNGVLLGQATYVAGGGAADAYTASINTTQITSYSDGLTLLVKSPATNTGASTINVNSLGVKTIVRNDGTALSAGDLVSGSIFSITYNSTTGKFHLASALASSGAYVQKAGDTMTGALTVPVVMNAATLSTSITIPADYNAGIVGPLTVSSGVTLTVTSGARLLIS